MIKNIYKVIFNHYVKRDGYTASSERLAALIVGLIVLFYLTAIYCTLLLLFSPQALQQANLHKGYGLIFAGVYFTLIYLILFYLLKIPRNGGETNNYLFPIDKKVTSLVWRLIIIGLVLFFISLFIAMVYLNPPKGGWNINV